MPDNVPPGSPTSAAPTAASRRRPSARGLTLVVAGAGLLACAPSPTEAIQTLRTAFTGAALSAAHPLDDVTGPVVALLSLVAWCLVTWLATTALLTGGSRLPGAAGRVSAGVVRRIAPRTVRRALEIALGLTVATGVACAGPASASYGGSGIGPPPREPATAASAVAVPGSLDWPMAASTVTPAATSSPSPAAAQVVVAPGDTLWDLAARSLGDGARPAVIAQAWPAWWAANRDVIGTDPDLLQPGDRLTPPAP